jgi:predicted amidohydrolase YtcJ
MAATSTAAGQIGMAGQLGTLESGKLADLTILEKDPYAVDPDALVHVKVSETWVGGRKMFE